MISASASVTALHPDAAALTERSSSPISDISWLTVLLDTPENIAFL